MFIEKFIACACFGEGLRVVYDQEDGDYSVSIWQEGYRNPVEWKHRFRLIWRILRTGRAWDDQIILRGEEARQMAAFLANPPSASSEPEERA